MLEIVRFSCYQENWSLRPVGDGTLRHSSRRAGRGGQRVGRQTCCVTPSHSLLTLLNCVAVSVWRKTVSIALKHWWVYSRPCLGLSLLWIEALFHPPYAMLEACQNAPRYPGAYCRLKRQGSRNRNSSFSSQNGKLTGFSSHRLARMDFGWRQRQGWRELPQSRVSLHLGGRFVGASTTE